MFYKKHTDESNDENLPQFSTDSRLPRRTLEGRRADSIFQSFGSYPHWIEVWTRVGKNLV